MFCLTSLFALLFTLLLQLTFRLRFWHALLKWWTLPHVKQAFLLLISSIFSKMRRFKACFCTSHCRAEFTFMFLVTLFILSMNNWDSMNFAGFKAPTKLGNSLNFHTSLISGRKPLKKLGEIYYLGILYSGPNMLMLTEPFLFRFVFCHCFASTFFSVVY